MRPAPCGGDADVGALHRKAGVLPIGEPTDVAADVAVAVGGQGVERGANVLTLMIVGVQDDLVIALQRLERAPWAGEA
jgi:hypothetical protein